MALLVVFFFFRWDFVHLCELWCFFKKSCLKQLLVDLQNFVWWPFFKQNINYWLLINFSMLDPEINVCIIWKTCVDCHIECALWPNMCLKCFSAIVYPTLSFKMHCTALLAGFKILILKSSNSLLQWFQAGSNHLRIVQNSSLRKQSNCQPTICAYVWWMLQ